MPARIALMEDLMNRFNSMLEAVTGNNAFTHVHYLDLRGTLDKLTHDRDGAVSDPYGVTAVPRPVHGRQIWTHGMEQHWPLRACCTSNCGSSEPPVGRALAAGRGSDGCCSCGGRRLSAPARGVLLLQSGSKDKFPDAGTGVTILGC